MSENEEQLSDAIESKALMTSLKANAGWVRFCEVVQERIAERDRALDHPLTSMDEVLNEQYVKGARQAYRHVLDVPDSIIAASEAVIEMVETLPEEGEDDGPEEGE